MKLEIGTERGRQVTLLIVILGSFAMLSTTIKLTMLTISK